MSTSDGISASGPSSTNTSPPQTALDAPASVAQSSVAGDGLKCEWVGCSDRLPSPEKLYDHVCERHVGRKSTNNLNLTCGWGNCRTTTVKRDHITSHIRVHVPLKPHKCEFCQKAFKRPQDLKKHVKTHAEDPNFQASPEPTRASHSGATGVFAGQSKHVADLQHLAATASGYYPEHHALSAAGVYPSHYNTAANNPSAYHGPSNHYQSNYMTTLYPVNTSSMSEYEIRKKATFDALNEFFGDIKTRQLDPSTYHAVGQRLMGLSGLPGMGAADYGQAGAAIATAPAPMNNHYSLPMSNIRSKNDLQHIDQFLEQLQATVYEHETQAAQAAQAGIHQAGSHYMHPAVNMRSSHSPPHMGASHQSQVSAHHVLPPIASTAQDTTPALTPASTVMSYNSPGSVHSSTVSPISRGSNASMYPTLPSVSSVSDASGSALPSALASSFDADSRRRYSAGLLQRSRGEATDTELPNIGRLGVRSPSLASVDPALTGESDRKTASPPPSIKEESGKDESKDVDGNDSRADPDWLTKVRVLETIRSIIKQRLENNEFEEDDETETVKADSPPAETQDEKDARELYPVLRAVQEAD